jgi:hypothetical protein
MIARHPPLPYFPVEEIGAITEREQTNIIEDFLVELMYARGEDSVTITRRLALEIARLLPRVKRLQKGHPPRTAREVQMQRYLIDKADRLRTEKPNMSKGAAKRRAAEEVAASDKRLRGGMSPDAIADALNRKSRLPK